MAYVKIMYQDSPSTATPMNAKNLNHMDNQIALNDQRLTEIETSYVKSFNGRKGEVVPVNGDYDIGQISPLMGAQVGQVPVVTNIGTEEDPELVFKMGAGGGGGHSIIDSSGNTMPQESAMQFPDSHVTDDETNGRTIVENIKEHTTASDYENATEDGIHVIDDGNDVPIGASSEDKVEVTGDGAKTYQQLFNDLYSEIDTSKININSYVSQKNASSETIHHLAYLVGNGTWLAFCNVSTSTGTTYTATIVLNASASVFTVSLVNKSNDLVPNGEKLIFHYGTSSTVINLKTDANYCQYDENTTVKDRIKLTEGKNTTFNFFWYRQGNIVNIVAPNGQRTASQYEKFRGIPTPVKSYLFNESNNPSNLFVVDEDATGAYLAPQYALSNTWSAFSLTYICKD